MSFKDKIYNLFQDKDKSDNTLSNLLYGEIDSVKINEESSLSIAAVWRCVSLISDTIATLPISLYEKRENARVKLNTHLAYNIIKNPNTYLSTTDIIGHLVMSTVLWGNGYLRIHRNEAFEPYKLTKLMPYEVYPQLLSNDVLIYNVDGHVLQNYDIIHLKGLVVNGVIGKSPIQAHRENLELEKLARTFGKKYFDQGGNVGGVFTAPGKLQQNDFDKLKSDLQRRYQGIFNSHIPLVLEGGMTYQKVNIPLEDAQFLETRKFQKNEIATMFGVPPHMIGDLERSTNNNIEHQGMEFVTHTLMPYLRKLELELEAKLIFDSDRIKSNIYFKFNANALMRGDTQTRGDFYDKMLRCGAMTPNQIRALEEMDSYDEGNLYYLMSNMLTVNRINNNNDV